LALRIRLLWSDNSKQTKLHKRDFFFLEERRKEATKNLIKKSEIDFILETISFSQYDMIFVFEEPKASIKLAAV